MFRKGIEVLQKDIATFKLAGMHEELKLNTKQLSSAFASIAELFMNDPLWYDQ
jgi:hypothetical protein